MSAPALFARKVATTASGTLTAGSSASSARLTEKLKTCRACRRLARTPRCSRPFSSSGARLPLDFQPYPMTNNLGPPPRKSEVPDASIARPLRIRMRTAGPERESQQSKENFVGDEGRIVDGKSAPSISTASSPKPGAGSQTEKTVSKKTPPPSASPTGGPVPVAKPMLRPHLAGNLLRTPRKAAMKLTPAAVSQLRVLLDGPEPKLIKVGVRNRGCSGLAYHLEFVDVPGRFDETVEQDGVKVLIDSKALFSIIGSEMDWVEDQLSARFVFRNPNIKEQCGCGESFMV